MKHYENSDIIFCMECEICGKALVKNGIKNGVQYYYCAHCKKSYSGKPKAPSHHILEEYTARRLYAHCAIRKNELTNTQWTINQIARLLGHRHQDIKKWLNNKTLPKISKSKLVSYLEQRENGTDILCVLGYRFASEPSDTIKEIITRKQRAKYRDKRVFTLKEPEYLRLVNMPISNRVEAIFILGALLGCKSGEMLSLKYSDIDYTEKTLEINRTITFGKEFAITENSKYISHRTYPLTQKMIDVIEWLKADTENNAKRVGNIFNAEFADFLCIDENGNFIKPYFLNKQTSNILDKAGITTTYAYIWKSIYGIQNYAIKQFQFKWLRCTVKEMMLKAGVSKDAVKSIFDNRQQCVYLEKIQSAYDLLDQYINENSKQYLS